MTVVSDSSLESVQDIKNIIRFEHFDLVFIIDPVPVQFYQN